jgi:23S rRNA (pseudouridine1915-N3)-methyltransferase
MEILLTAIRPRQWRVAEPARQLVAAYLKVASRATSASFHEFRSEAALWASIDKRSGRSPAFVILADRTGRPLDSEHFAQELAAIRDRGTQQLVLAVGPADGWSTTALQRADLLLSLGPMTLPHELAAVITAEQLYRATAIWSGHPYHRGH